MEKSSPSSACCVRERLACACQSSQRDREHQRVTHPGDAFEFPETALENEVFVELVQVAAGALIGVHRVSPPAERSGVPASSA